MTIEEDKNYFINNPVFIKYKTKFDFSRWARVKSLKKAFVNERIVEIPYAIYSLKNLSQEETLLDLGCTESILPLNIASLGFKVVGFDFRSYPYNHPNLKIVRGDILKLPFKDKYFGAVFCISTIEHLGIGFYRDPKQTQEADILARDEINRVLKPGGLLILTVPYGIAKETNQQRVYDADNLSRLLTHFRINELKYYTSTSNNGGVNFWQEVDKDQAGTIDSQDFTQCVCIVNAQKQ